MSAGSSDQESYKYEYKLVFDGCKFFVTLRFSVVAFAMSINSALLTLYSSQAIKENKFLELSIFGIVLVFWVALLIVELRTTFIFHSFMKRGNELEFQIGNPHGFFHRIEDLSKTKGFYSLIRHRWGIGLVYAGMFILWLMLFVAAVIIQSQP